MINYAKRVVKSLVYAEDRAIPVRWIRRNENSWLTRNFPEEMVKPSRHGLSRTIEKIAAETNQLGPQPLWDGYFTKDPENKRGSTRMADEVRTKASMGDLYTDLVVRRRPEVIVEFGTAFGVSGMYFLAGVEMNKKGRLLTFDPNKTWAEIANANLARISDRFALTVGTFEDNIDEELAENEKIDLAFVDAIHTSEFVLPQLEIVMKRVSPKALIILDDINFSEDMKNCWEQVSKDERFSASASFGNRVGILELLN